MANKEMKTIQFPDNPNVYEIVDNKARQSIINLDQDKTDLATYAVGTTGLVQADAITILNNIETYEGKIIQFYSNGEEPRHLISWGFIIRDTDSEHKPYLIELDRNGHTIKWTLTTNYNTNDGISYREI